MSQLELTTNKVVTDYVETALLIGIQGAFETGEKAAAHLAELSSLTRTMGVEEKASIMVRLREPSPRYYLGSGKAEEIAARAEELDVDCVVFDDDLSPAQQRNWERLTGRCVIDRQEVILEIFATRAATREAVLQVALARMEYSLPRLTRAWTHLSRQRGGRRGTKGEGEMQLEADRRIVLNKIAALKKELLKVREQRATRRKQRQAVPVPTAAIVGYTNVGKSSLLNALTGATAFVENKLFATLDPTTRRLSLSNGADVLLTDTVGFIRKLPHDLIDAFKSTLEETVLADYLVHVLDVASPEVESHYATTISVLEEIGAGNKKSITVFNKADLVEDPGRLEHLRSHYPGAFFVSVKTGAGIGAVAQQLKSFVYTEMPLSKFSFPSARYDLAALIHRSGRVIRETYEEDRILLSAQVPEKTLRTLAAYVIG